MQFEKNAGFSLLTGSILLVVTMVLHPAGGDFEHLLKATRMIVIAHSLAIISIPVCMAGFWGVTKRLGTDNFQAMLAMCFMLVGLIAGVCAAAINGLALPIYVNHYKEADSAVIASLKFPLRYGTSLNHAFDYIFIGAICISITFWSTVIIHTRKMPAWLGYFGMALAVLALVMLASGFVFTNLYGFRVFVFGLVGWIVSAGVVLMKQQPV